MLTAFAAAAESAGKIPGQTASELTNLAELILIRLPLWFAALIILVVFYFLARIGRSMMENKLAESGIEDQHEEVQILGGRITFATILILGITISLKVAGIDLTAIIAAAAFGIGFALKDLIMNFLAGIFILLSRHFTIGDFISVGGTLGKVIEIQSRVTILQAINGTKVIVPNGAIFSNKVISYTSNPFRRIDVKVAVDYRGDIENAIKVCLETAKNTKGVLLQPKPSVLVTEWGKSNITIKVRAWVESRGGWLKIRSALYQNLKKAYTKYNINLAWNVVQVINDKDLEHDKEIKFDEKTKAKQIIDTETAKKAIPQETTMAVQPAQTITQTASVPVDFDVEGQPLKPLNEL